MGKPQYLGLSGGFAEAALAGACVACLALLVQPVLGVGVAVELSGRLGLMARPAEGK